MADTAHVYSMAEIERNGVQVQRNLEALMLRRYYAIGAETVAKAISRDKAAISRIFSGKRGSGIHELGAVLDALGLAVIESSSDTVTVSRAEHDALLTLARKALSI